MRRSRTLVTGVGAIAVLGGRTPRPRRAEQLTREGTPVRYVRSIFVPEDETWFVLCEAASPDMVREVARRADLQFERIAEAVAPETLEEVERCR